MPKYASASNVAAVVRKWDGKMYVNVENKSECAQVKDVMAFGLNAGVSVAP